MTTSPRVGRPDGRSPGPLPARGRRGHDAAEAPPTLLVINAGSSSIKFALYRLEEPIVRSLRGKLDRLGREDAELTCIDEIADPPRRLRFDDRGPRPTPTA